MLPTRQFRGNQFWRELVFWEGGEGGCLNSQSTVVSFPGNTLVSLATEKSSLQSSAGRPRLGLGCSQQLPTAKASRCCSPGPVSWGVGGVGRDANTGHSPAPFASPCTCASSYSSSDHCLPGLEDGIGKNGRNHLETSLRAAAPEDPKVEVKALGWAA